MAAKTHLFLYLLPSFSSSDIPSPFSSLTHLPPAHGVAPFASAAVPGPVVSSPCTPCALLLRFVHFISFCFASLHFASLRFCLSLELRLIHSFVHWSPSRQTSKAGRRSRIRTRTRTRSKYPPYLPSWRTTDFSSVYCPVSGGVEVVIS